jgi:hypothetical protein
LSRPRLTLLNRLCRLPKARGRLKHGGVERLIASAETAMHSTKLAGGGWAVFEPARHPGMSDTVDLQHGPVSPAAFIPIAARFGAARAPGRLGPRFKPCAPRTHLMCALLHTPRKICAAPHRQTGRTGA